MENINRKFNYGFDWMIFQTKNFIMHMKLLFICIVDIYNMGFNEFTINDIIMQFGENLFGTENNRNINIYSGGYILCFLYMIYFVYKIFIIIYYQVTLLVLYSFLGWYMYVFVIEYLNVFPLYVFNIDSLKYKKDNITQYDKNIDDINKNYDNNNYEDNNKISKKYEFDERVM